MLLHDEIIIFSRASVLKKMKMALSLNENLEGNMLFQEFVKTLAISVKIIFLESGKFENIQKLSSTFKNLRKD